MAPLLPLVVFLQILAFAKGQEDLCLELTARFATRAPDGVSKEVITLNGQFPGPTIRAKLGDRMTIRVHNRLRDRKGTKHGTSVHFHGIEMKGSPWMDGPEQVTQCPIVYGGYMDYSFTLLQAGTYWYHSHHSWQYIDGFWGFFIVDNTNATIPESIAATLPNATGTGGVVIQNAHKYDDELQISLMDWHWRTGGVLTDIINLPSTANYSNFEASQPPIPDSALINGWGNANCKNATSLNYTCYDSVPETATIMNVIPCLTYRIRVLNPSARASFIFSIQGHKLRVIEVDGVDTVEVAPVDQVRIWPAQRYSFLVTMDMDTARFGQYAWIRARMVIEGPRQDLLDKRLPLIRPLAALRYYRTPPPARFLGRKNCPVPPTPRGLLPDATGDEAEVTAALSLSIASVGGGGQGRPSDLSLPWEDPIVQQFAPAAGIAGGAAFAPATVCNFEKILNNTDKMQERVYRGTIVHNPIPQPTFPVILDQRVCYPLKPNCTSTKKTETVPWPERGHRVIQIPIETRIESTEHHFPRWYVNNVSYSSEHSYLPAIFRVMQERPVPKTFVPFHLPSGEVVDLIIHNRGGNHPYHLHGHTFWVLGSGNVNDGCFDPRKHTLDLKRGMKRDTTHLLSNSWAVLRFVTNNPGVWIMHCHIHWHFHHGFAMVFVEGEDLLRENYTMPAESRRVCRANDVIV